MTHTSQEYNIALPLAQTRERCNPPSQARGAPGAFTRIWAPLARQGRGIDGLKIQRPFVPAAVDLILGNLPHQRPQNAPWIWGVEDLCLMLYRQCPDIRQHVAHRRRAGMRTPEITAQLGRELRHQLAPSPLTIVGGLGALGPLHGTLAWERKYPLASAPEPCA
ncbi:MAG TPA: hypothetical protein VFK16_06740 [Gemmatimonadaceae bacterium]|nr:hypothetical protein [Gemmatimonadaceae bacterium]